MPSTLSLPTFIARWQSSRLSERSAAQSHFIFLRALGVNVEITLKDVLARPKDGESYGRPEVVAGVYQNKGSYPTSRPVLRCG